jgi:hypothetical protein
MNGCTDPELCSSQRASRAAFTHPHLYLILSGTLSRLGCRSPLFHRTQPSHSLSAPYTHFVQYIKPHSSAVQPPRHCLPQPDPLEPRLPL